MKPEAIAREWILAFNRHDVAALVALYAPDAIHVSPKLRVARPETGGRLAGRPALASWWTDAFARLPTLHYELTAVTAQPPRVFIEYLRHAAGEPPQPVAEVFRLRGGLIAASAVYHG
jgi:ketosteroid isomerase-like protein